MRRNKIHSSLPIPWSERTLPDHAFRFSAAAFLVAASPLGRLDQNLEKESDPIFLDYLDIFGFMKDIFHDYSG